MKICVCIKQVPDTEARIALKADGSGVVEDNLKYIISPYDEYAIEEALKTKEALGGEVVVMTAGPDRAQTALRDALALGADRAVHIKTTDTDPFALAGMLAAKIKEEGFDLVFCGKQAVDYDNAQVPVLMASTLGWPCVTVVSSVEMGDSKLTAGRDVEGGGKELVESTIPAVLAVTKGINQPRFKSLKGIMAAKKKKVDAVDGSSLQTDYAQKGRIVYKSFRLPPERKPGKKVEAEDPATAAEEVVRLLREEAKII